MNESEIADTFLEAPGSGFVLVLCWPPFPQGLSFVDHCIPKPTYPLKGSSSLGICLITNEVGDDRKYLHMERGDLLPCDLPGLFLIKPNGGIVKSRLLFEEKQWLEYRISPAQSHT